MYCGTPSSPGPPGLTSLPCLRLRPGHTPALACAPNKGVADCLALILATMMPLSPSSAMTAVNLVGLRKDNWSRTTLSNLGSGVSLSSNHVGSEDGYNENDSDSETF